MSHIGCFPPPPFRSSGCEALMQHFISSGRSHQRHVLVWIFHCFLKSKFQVTDTTVQPEAQVLWKTSPKKSATGLPPMAPPNPPHTIVFVKFCSLVVVELEVEAASWLKGVEVERPGLSSTSALLVFGVQWILACVKLLPHFWQNNEKKRGTSLRPLEAKSELNMIHICSVKQIWHNLQFACIMTINTF